MRFVAVLLTLLTIGAAPAVAVGDVARTGTGVQTGGQAATRRPTPNGTAVRPGSRAAAASRQSGKPGGAITPPGSSPRAARKITRPSEPSSTSASSSRWAGTLAALVLVVGLIAGLAWFWRRHGPTPLQRLPNEAVQILGRRGLDQRHTVVLLRVGNRLLVLSVSANGVQTLSEISDPVEVDTLAGLCRVADDATTAAFGQTFRTLLGKTDTGPAPANSKSAPAASAAAAAYLSEDA